MLAQKSNAPIDSNTGEPTRPCTSGIDYFGVEDSTSVESSTGEPSRSSCADKFGPPKMKLLPTPLLCDKVLQPHSVANDSSSPDSSFFVEVDMTC